MAPNDRVLLATLLVSFVCCSAENPRAQALKLYNQRCEAGDGYACQQLASLYQRGVWGAAGRRKALEFYRKACKAGALEGCESLLKLQRELKVEDQGVGELIASGREMAIQRCEQGDSDACDRIQNSYTSEDKQKAKEYFRKYVELNRKSCQEGYLLECDRLQIKMLLEPDFKMDWEQFDTMLKEAIETARKGCEKGNAQLCVVLAKEKILGVQLAKDREESARLLNGAAEIYLEACQEGNIESCDGLARLYESGSPLWWVLENPKKKAAYATACQGGSPLGCILSES